MNYKILNKEFIYLYNQLGLSCSSIHLGVKLSVKNQISLPLALWSYSLITTDELDQFYNYLWS